MIVIMIVIDPEIEDMTEEEDPDLLMIEEEDQDLLMTEEEDQDLLMNVAEEMIVIEVAVEIRKVTGNIVIDLATNINNLIKKYHY
jgi:hypothetical protein